MASIITIFGNLSSEPRLKTIKNNLTQVLRFSIVSESSNKKLTYFEVLSYDVSLAQKLKRGSLVQLTGEFELADSQTDEEGRLYTSLRVVADRIFILKSDPDNNASVEENNSSEEQDQSTETSYNSFSSLSSNDSETKTDTAAEVNTSYEKTSYAKSSYGKEAPKKRRGRPKRS